MSKTKSPAASAVDTSDLNSNADNEKVKIEWSIENEAILVEWCDVAQCYRWLHMRSNRTYNKLHMYFTIPTITLSTITGTASFAQASLPQDYQAWASMAIGAINIFIGIITTIQQYLKVSELNEAHRVSALSWDKYARNIRIELAKSPPERTDAKSFLKVCRQEFDRLMETSPSIPVSIVNEFKKTFKGTEGSDQREIYNNLKKPDILDIIISSDVNRHHWYVDEANQTKYIQSQEKLKHYSGEIDDSYFNFKNLMHGNSSRERKKSTDSFNSYLGYKSTTPNKSNRSNYDGYFNGANFSNSSNNGKQRNYDRPSHTNINENSVQLQIDENNSVVSSQNDIENANAFVSND